MLARHDVSGYEGRVLLLHTKDDEVIPVTEAADLRNQFLSRSAPQSQSQARLDEGEDDAAEAAGGHGCGHGSTADQGDADRGERCTIGLFETGGHNYIWPMNWHPYSRSILTFCSQVFPNSGGSQGQSQNYSDSEKASEGERENKATDPTTSGQSREQSGLSSSSWWGQLQHDSQSRAQETQQHLRSRDSSNSDSNCIII